MPKTVILVEDDPDDLFFFQRAFSKNIGDKELRVIRNGEDLISYLDQSVTRMEPDEESLPCLILLDMKMPRKSVLSPIGPAIMITPSFASLSIFARCRSWIFAAAMLS